MTISRETAIRVAIEHLISSIKPEDVFAEAAGVQPYLRRDEPVWCVRVPELSFHVGGTRYIIVSQITGEVVDDGVYGE